ncbi:hypothetical protein ACB092_06G277500 [Castanea dentata]
MAPPSIAHALRSLRQHRRKILRRYNWIFFPRNTEWIVDLSKGKIRVLSKSEEEGRRRRRETYHGWRA